MVVRQLVTWYGKERRGKVGSRGSGGLVQKLGISGRKQITCRVEFDPMGLNGQAAASTSEDEDEIRSMLQDFLGRRRMNIYNPLKSGE